MGWAGTKTTNWYILLLFCYNNIIGPLLAVSGLVRGFISDQTFSWNPPSTLDLTNVEPDIAYCVTIHNITCGRKDILISDCSLTDSFYIYEDIHPGLVYQIEVIPRSNVDRAMNGTPLVVKGLFTPCFKYSSLTKEGPCAVHLTLGPDKGVGHNLR